MRRRTGMVPLARALSKLGVASRTEAIALIRAGRVRVGGVVRRDPALAVTPEKAAIAVDGQRIRKARRIVLMLHKPRGVVTTRKDEKGRPTVFSLLGADAPAGLHAVGRLDLATTGLLLLTNDTRLSSRLTDPASAVPRVYVATVRGLVGERERTRIEAGVDDGGERLRADKIVVRKASAKESHVIVTLSEGKNREIRRMFDALGHEVTRLKRVAFGGLELGDLPPGKWREVSDEELAAGFPRLR